MERKAGKYALIQFCPAPERMEFVNIGVMLIVPEIGYIGVKISKSNARVERLFGKQARHHVGFLKESFENRLRHEFSSNFNDEVFHSFSRKRANEIRVSPIQSILISDDPDRSLESLFSELVGRDLEQKREPRIRRKLKEALARHRVEHYLDRPEEISLPEYGLKISAPYGYQNGCYNLLDGIRISENISDGLREVGKKSIEGNLLWKHYENLGDVCKRLVVVGDFSNQSNEFYHAVDEQFHDANMKLYRLDNLRPLLDDIERNVAA